METIEQVFKAFVSALQMATLYGTGHQKFAAYLDAAFAKLSSALTERGEFAVGIVGNEIACGSEILFELSRSLKPVIQFLKARNVERIVFRRGMKKEELFSFISFLLASKGETSEPEKALAARGVRSISAGRIKADATAIASREDINFHLNFKSLYGGSVETVESLLEQTIDLKELDYLDVKFNVNSLMDAIVGGKAEILKLATLKRYDYNTFFHALNVSILAMYFSSMLGLGRETVRDIGVAALFHDIGKVRISRRIITKAGALTNDEFERISGHSALGAAIMLRYVDALGVLPVVVAFEHHMRAGGRSYPKVSYPRVPHLASQIVSVCDVFDALSQRRSYKGTMPPDTVYSIMTRDRGLFYQPRLLDLFFQLVGIWPLATVVELSDGRIGIVRRQNEQDIKRPVVEIVSPEDKKATLDLSLHADCSIVKALEPSAAGKGTALEMIREDQGSS